MKLQARSFLPRGPMTLSKIGVDTRKENFTIEFLPYFNAMFGLMNADPLSVYPWTNLHITFSREHKLFIHFFFFQNQTINKVKIPTWVSNFLGFFKHYLWQVTLV